MSLSPQLANHRARVIPIHAKEPSSWQSDLLRHLTRNPRHLKWLINRPVIEEFTDRVLLTQMVHARADEIVIYHSPFRFEISFRCQGRRHLIDVPNHRWAMPIVRRLMHLAGMDVTDHEAWQVGQMTIGGDTLVNVWHYPTARSERLVMRPRWGQALEGDAMRVPPPPQSISHL